MIEFEQVVCRGKSQDVTVHNSFPSLPVLDLCDDESPADIPCSNFRIFLGVAPPFFRERFPVASSADDLPQNQ